MPLCHAVRPTLLVVLLLSASVSPVFAQTTAELFDPDALQEIRLFMNSRDLQQLKARFDENTFYTADLLWRNSRVRNVAVRSRGSASRSSTKPGLEIDFGRYVRGQEFLGLTTLVLDNLWQDAAMIREQVAMTFFRRMGQPAPRETFCRLYINSSYYGVYGVVEAVDAGFLSRTFEDTTGYLFEFKKVRQYYGEDLGDDLAPYKAFFEPRNHRLEADQVLYSPIRDLFREVNHADDPVWRDRVEARIDLAQFVTHVAIETFLAEPDGILGFGGMNNFYLYRHADTQLHSLIPWDKDLTFSAADSPILLRADENELFRRALAFDDLRARYFGTLEDCARSAAADGWLKAELARAASLVTEAALEDTLKPVSNERFAEDVDFLMEFASMRPSFVLREVEALRQERDAPLQLRLKTQDRISPWPIRRYLLPPDPSRGKLPSSDD